MAAPTTPEKRAERINFVRKCLSAQMNHSDIRRATAKRFGCSERMATNYIAMTYREIEKEGQLFKPQRTYQLRESYQRVYQRAFEMGNMAACVAALDRLARIDGVITGDQVQIPGLRSVDTIANNLTTADRKKRLDALFSLYEAKAAEEAKLLTDGSKANGKANGKTNGKANGSNGSGH